MMLTAIVMSLAACVLAVLLTCLARRLARALELTDKPDGLRKLHREATPLGGGLAVFFTPAILVTVLCTVENPWRAGLAAHRVETLGLLLAGAVIVMVGLLDDRMGLRGRQKLAGQLFAAGILVACGLTIDRIQVFGWSIDLGLLALPFTIFWLLGAINSVNLLDGIDGLATTIGIIQSSAIAVLAMMTGHPEVALVAALFACSLAGFLLFNFPPASIYLGDAGSMLIGLVVGALAIQASLKGAGTVLLAAPLAVWTIPVFDSAAAILRRKLTGRSLYATDRGHIHHRLVYRFGNRKALGILAVSCAFACAGALWSTYLHSDGIALISCAALVFVFAASRAFGYSEVLLIAARGRSFVQSLFVRDEPTAADGWQASVHLQGTRHWDILWASLTESADKLELRYIQLDVNAPMLEESYHASWNRPVWRDRERNWSLEIPLLVNDCLFGSLQVVGGRNGCSSGESIERLLDLLEPFETHFQLMTSKDGEVSERHELSPGGDQGEIPAHAEAGLPL